MSTILLDVRLADDFAEAHLQGAVNQPVFEVQFGKEIAEKFPDLNTSFEVYGASETSLEAAMAVEKLKRLGYEDSSVLAGGFAWASENPSQIKTGPALPAPPPPLSGRQEINTADSQVAWTGRNLLNNHTGTVGIQSGFLDFSTGELVGGEVILDLENLECTDLAGSEVHDILIDHLHNDDFLDLAVYPTAILRILASERIIPHAGAPNLRVTGELTIKGTTLPLEFIACTGLTPEGQAAAQASFAIDRTDWGINYGSGKLFNRLAGHLVNDLIEFQVKIVTV